MPILFFVFAIQVSNVLLFNEIIPCHHFSYIDFSPSYCLMFVIYLFDGELAHVCHGKHVQAHLWLEYEVDGKRLSSPPQVMCIII